MYPSVFVCDICMTIFVVVRKKTLVHAVIKQATKCF